MYIFFIFFIQVCQGVTITPPAMEYYWYIVLLGRLLLIFAAEGRGIGEIVKKKYVTCAVWMTIGKHVNGDNLVPAKCQPFLVFYTARKALWRDVLYLLSFDSCHMSAIHLVITRKRKTFCRHFEQRITILTHRRDLTYDSALRHLFKGVLCKRSDWCRSVGWIVNMTRGHEHGPRVSPWWETW